MKTLARVDPELRAELQARPNVVLSQETLQKVRRAFIAGAVSAQAAPEPCGPRVEELRVPSAFGAPDIRVLAYRPGRERPGHERPGQVRPGQARSGQLRSGQAEPGGMGTPLPAIVHVHGGGFVLGAPEISDAENRVLAAELQCAVYSVDYRLAPEAPYPAAMQDVYSVLSWLHENAGTLSIDPQRVGIKGESAGGGIAAGMTLYARDVQGPLPAFQHLIYPMIDDRSAIGVDVPEHVGEFVWTQAHNLFGWSAMLGARPSSDDVPPYAAAARARDLRGLPPTYVSVGDLDLFCDENIAFARALARAGVPVELHVYPGAYHGFRSSLQARVAQQAVRDSREALRRALHG